MRGAHLGLAMLVAVAAGCYDFDRASICDGDPQASPACPGYVTGDASADANDAAEDTAAAEVADAPDSGPGDAEDPDACPVGTCVTVSKLSDGIGNTVCAILSDGSVRCWGWNNEGQVGDGTKESRKKPVRIPALQGAVSITTGVQHSCAVLGDHSAVCWGANASGQLGDGTTAPRLVPTAVKGLSNVSALALGDAATCALLQNGTISCWGSGVFAGDGASTPHLAPAAVPSIASVSAIAASKDSVCVRRPFGVVTCWGANSGGTAGAGDTSAHLSPIDVSGKY